MKTTVKSVLKTALAVALAVPALVFGDEALAISDPTPVLLNTDSYYLWRTATGGTMRVEWAFPLNATVASLAVTGRTFKTALTGITTEYAEVELPAPATAKDEDVLDFTLSFNDGSVKTASLGLVRGRSENGGATTATACLASTNSTAWRRATKYFVLPVPEGAEAVTVAGEMVDTGLDGAAGWLALGPYASGATVPVADDDVSCDLWVFASGSVISIR